MARLHAAVDVGGTFIDVVMADMDAGRLTVSKLPNALRTGGEDLAAVIERLAGDLGATVRQIESVVIGTTVVTNALLEGALARTALVTTRGFRDVLEIARMTRPSPYDLQRRRPSPLVPRSLRLEIDERVASDGLVLRAMSDDEVRGVARRLREEVVESVAVSFLFSFINPDHEQRALEILNRELGVPVSASSDVLPVFREYERTNTTVVNASTVKVIERFIDSLRPLLARGVGRVYIMGSEGGCLTLPEARRYPVRCIMSGPAGGVIGGLGIAGRHGFESALTLDVGGTSTDVALVHHGVLPYTDERTIGGYSVALPSVEVETVGAGGGSIASIDPTGLLKVGPLSAGADPGPICYRRGGERPTVTDAHVALGHIGIRTMLGGEFEVDRDAAVRGIEHRLAQPMRLSWIRAAQGILEVATANIVRAVRSISVERGYDPRSMTLIAFGGAGPLHSVDVARALDIPRVMVPRYPGVWSAYGILSSDIRYAAYRTWFHALHEVHASEVEAAFGALLGGLIARVASDGLDAASFRAERAMDLRYRGQSHTLTIPAGDLSAGGLAAVGHGFHAEHERRYGHAAPEDIIEVVNLRASVIYPRVGIGPLEPAEQRAPAMEADHHRQVWFSHPDPLVCPVYQRAHLGPKQVIAGPAVVEQYDSTIVLAPEDRMEVMADGVDALIHVSPSRLLEKGFAQGH